MMSDGDQSWNGKRCQNVFGAQMFRPGAYPAGGAGGGGAPTPETEGRPRGRVGRRDAGVP